MNQFLWGILAGLCSVTGLFFLRFWKTTHDRFFMLFAIAFFVFACNWVGLALANPATETRHFFYLVRLAAFVLIIAAILDKNRAAERVR